MKRALLFDLDETLIVEEPAAVTAFEATAQFAASRCEIDPASLATGARLRARELWYAAPILHASWSLVPKLARSGAGTHRKRFRVGLVMPVDTKVARPLVEGLTTATVVPTPPGPSRLASRRSRLMRLCAARSRRKRAHRPARDRSRDYGPLERVLVGSVSAKLIHAAPCPALAVPRPSKAAAPV